MWHRRLGLTSWALLAACKPPIAEPEAPRVDFLQPTAESDLDEGEALTVVITIEDPDEDAPIQVSLSLNGDAVGEVTLETARGEATFEVAPLPPGQITLVATANDGTAEPRELARDFFVNAAPTMPVLRVTPAQPSDDSDLVGELQTPGTDPDGGAVSNAWRWLRNGETALSGVTFPAVLPAALTSKGDSWTLEVVVTESSPPGTVDPPLTSSAAVTVEIVNDPPSTPTISLWPAAPTPLHALVCSAEGSVDPQGDAVSYVYAWSRDRGQGLELQAQHTGARLDATFVKPGDTWQCAASATDGSALSEPATASVGVDDSPSEATAADVSLAATAPRIAPTLHDLDGDGALDHLAAGDPDAGVVRFWTTADLVAGSVDDAAPASFFSGPLGFGTSVLRIGDATGDGAPDLAIGGAESDGHRSLWVVSAVETPLVGEAEADTVALQVNGGADLGLGVAASNGFGTGRPELYVSDTDALNTSVVRVFASNALVYPSLTLAEEALATLGSSHGRDGLGRALATGELNGAAVGSEADLLIGIPRAAPVGDPTCAVGITGLALGAGGDLYQLDGFVQILNDEGEQCGASVLLLPDLNGDASDEIVIGIPGWNGDRGRVVLIPSGFAVQTTIDLRRDEHTVELTGPMGAALFGARLSSPGDVDGDGKAELAVIAPDARGGDGRVYFFEGASLASAMDRAVAGTPERIADFEADWIVEGAENAGLGTWGPYADLDGDGAVDLLLSDAYGTLSVILTSR
jgi:hypothetical protein